MLDKASPIPLYYQLQNTIRELIRSQRINPGERLPSLNDFASSYDVSLAVVRQAVHGLVQEGMVEAHQGRGLFVGQPKRKYYLDLLNPQLYENAAQMGVRLKIVDHTRQVLPASKSVAERLELPIGERVIQALKIYYANDIPVELAYVYFPYSVCPELESPNLFPEHVDKLWQEYIYNKITKSITWASAKLADEEEEALLVVELGEPVLVIEGLSKNMEGIPIQFYIASVISDRLKMGINIEQLELDL
jgi:GntR family transcriptional regulator